MALFYIYKWIPLVINEKQNTSTEYMFIITYFTFFQQIGFCTVRYMSKCFKKQLRHVKTGLGLFSNTPFWCWDSDVGGLENKNGKMLVISFYRVSMYISLLFNISNNEFLHFIDSFLTLWSPLIRKNWQILVYKFVCLYY